MRNIYLKNLCGIIDKRYYLIMADRADILYGDADDDIVPWEDPEETVKDEGEVIRARVASWIRRYGANKTTCDKCNYGLILGDRVCNVMYGDFNKNVISWDDVPYWEFGEAGRVWGFQFEAESEARVDTNTWVTILGNYNKPVIPPSVTPVPGELNTYRDTANAEKVYRFLPSDSDLDQGYLLIYHRKFLMAIIDGFTRAGDFRRESEPLHMSH